MEEGIERSYKNANVDWVNEATKRVLWLARHKKFFTSDDVLTYLSKKEIKTKNNSALGGVMLRAKANGWVKASGFTFSSRPSRHHAPVRIWKSLLEVKK